ncbi:PREP family protein [Megaselia abdita]
MLSNNNYPSVPKDERIVENHHGVEVSDVYRWLEDPDSEETKSFVKQQNDISEQFLRGPEWNQLHQKITRLWNYPKYSCPTKEGDKYYYFHNTGLQNHPILYQQDSLDSEAKIFFDPNVLSEDGKIALTIHKFSDDGKFFAYALSESGSDWKRIKVKDVPTGNDFPEILERVKYSSIQWTKDNKGFFYGAFFDQEGKTDGSEIKYQKLYYHILGSSQAEDILVASFPENPTWLIGFCISECGDYLVYHILQDSKDNIVYYSYLHENVTENLEINKVIEKFEAIYTAITNNSSKFYFLTNKDAPNYRIIEIDFENPAEENWRTVIQEDEKDVIDSVTCVNDDKLLVGYIQDVKTVLKVYNLTGVFINEFPMYIGTVNEVYGKRKSSEVFYKFTSFHNPGTIYHYNFNTPEKFPTIFRQMNIDGFNKENFKIDQKFYPSKDATQIPMFIISRNTDEIKPKPCLLYGYGGYGVSTKPLFNITGLMMTDTFDGVFAIANIRGGGEYGDNWHNGGRLFNKQNGFDDFKNAAEYLVNQKYTSHDKLCIFGGSNGGLLIGACINQRPDLFGAAIADVGIFDMLRFHKFTIGHFWISEFGNPDEKDHFENIIKYSPLHNVHEPKSANEEYPATLILTADHDDRVSPLHSYKFTAALQNAVRNSKYQNKPILLKVYTDAGHGMGKPSAKRIDKIADMYSFIMKSLNCEIKIL